MLFAWNEDTIRWYLSASEYTGFHRNLADIVRPMLAGCRTMCDLGCGLGLLDFEVAPMMDFIDCVDISEAALSFIAERAQKLGIRNIRTRLEDCGNIRGEWDAVFMSFFGALELDSFLPLCKRLIAVVSAAGEADLLPTDGRPFRKNTVDDTAKYLDGKNIRYNLTLRRLEFGQPLKSLEEARSFVKAYLPDLGDGEIDSFLEKRLVQTGRADFPYYLPRAKPVGIFELGR